MQTHFSQSVSAESDDETTFDIIDSHPPGTAIEMKLLRFLLNTREIVGILSNLWFNQIKILVNTRVQYSREDFNFESYLSFAMHDERLVRNAFFCKSGKQLVAEYFKF